MYGLNRPGFVDLMKLIARLFYQLFLKKITIAKWKFNLVLLVSFVSGILFYTFYLLSPFLISTIFASSTWSQTSWAGGQSDAVATTTITTYKAISDTDPTTSAGNITLTQTSNWYNSAWKYRRKVTFDNTTSNIGVTSEALTDFPVLLKLSSSNIDYANTQNSGQDIRITDSNGTTLLNYEIEKWDESGTSYVWTKVPSVDIDSSTDYVYVYYGNSAALDAQAATSVWNSNFKMVQHMEESGNGTSGEFIDSTSNDNDGTGGSSAYPDLTASGKINGAQNFNGSSDYISMPAAGLLKGSAQYTMEAWLYPTVLPVGGTLDAYNEMVEDNTNSSRAQFGMSDTNCTGDKFVLRFRTGLAAQSGMNLCSTTTPEVNTWYHVVAVVDATNDAHKLYVNGAVQGTNTTAVDGVNNTNPANTPRIGSFTANTEFWPGYIDEFRVSSTARSAAWIAAEYKNMTDAYTTFASQEAQYQSSGTLTSNIFDTGAAGADWGTFTYNATVPSGQGVTVKVRTSNDSGMSGATAFGSCSAITSGNDISANGCVTDGHRYIQYLVTITSDATTTATFQDTAIVYDPRDSTAPTTNASSITMSTAVSGGRSVASNGWNNTATPYFSWTAGADNAGGIGLQGYCIYLGSTADSDPSTGSGLLTNSPVATTGTTCGYIASGTTLDLSAGSYLASALVSGTTYYVYIKAVDSADNVFAGSSASFQFREDIAGPTNVTSISTPGSTYSNVVDMFFSWPVSGGTAASDANSGLLGYQYQINSTAGTWLGTTSNSTCSISYIPAATATYTLTELQDEASIVSGNNTVYFRTVDTACNTSSTATYRTGLLLYGGAAPTFGGSDAVTITPSTSTSNSFALSWPAATAADGQTVTKYYYMINTTPPSSLSTLQGNASTYIDNGTSRTVSATALPNVNRGSNTVYVVAIDNADTPNYSPSNVITGTFTLNSTDPDNVGNLVASDSSIKSQSQWNVTLTWTAPSYQGAGNLTYLIYRSTDGTNFSQVGTSSGLSYVDNAPSSSLFYYKIYTKDGADAQSSGTNAVSITPTGRWTSAPSLDSGPTVSSITTSKATITWSTGRTSDSKISYGTSSGSYGSVEPSNSTQTTSHSIQLTGLTPGTTYYYKAKWTDEDGNTGTSDEKTFSTAPAPTVKDVIAKNIGLTSGILQFTSSGASSVKIYYGTTTSFGGVKTISTSTSETTYTAEITDLTDGVKYYYKINTFDGDGTEYEGTVLDFATLPRPRISNVRIQQVANTAQSAVLVSWTSNTQISSIVTYYPENNPAAAKDEVSVALITGAHQMIVRGLLPQTTYNLVVKGRDKIGNEASSDIQRVTTATDTRPPLISGLHIEGASVPAVASSGQISTAQLIVSWNTDEPSTSQIEFGEGSGATYSQKTQMDSNLTVNHLVILSGMTPSKVYHLRAVSQDAVGNITNSLDNVTITPKTTENALNLVITNLQQAFGFLGDIRQK